MLSANEYDRIQMTICTQLKHFTELLADPCATHEVKPIPAAPQSVATQYGVVEFWNSIQDIDDDDVFTPMAHWLRKEFNTLPIDIIDMIDFEIPEPVIIEPVAEEHVPNKYEVFAQLRQQIMDTDPVILRRVGKGSSLQSIINAINAGKFHYSDNNMVRAEKAIKILDMIAQQMLLSLTNKK